jgi:hypothetical protein
MYSIESTAISWKAKPELSELEGDECLAKAEISVGKRQR